MKGFAWNEEKNKWLKEHRDIPFVGADSISALSDIRAEIDSAPTFINFTYRKNQDDPV